MFLLSRPIEFHLTPDQIDKTTPSLPGHLETHYRPAPFSLEALRLLGGLGLPASAVDESSFLGLRLLPLRFELLCRRIVPVGMTFL